MAKEPLTQACAAVLLVLCAILPAQAAASQDGDLYTARVPVTDQSSKARNAALEQALGKVLVRVSGNADAARTSAGRTIVGQAENLVGQYGYEQGTPAGETQAAASGEQAAAGEAQNTSPPLYLRARFEKSAVDDALRQHGMPVWGQQRPRTLAWVAVVSGNSASLLPAGDARAAALEQVARRRGLSLTLPRLDAAERNRVNVADVLQMHTDRLQALASGYGDNHILVARVHHGQDYSGSFTLADASGTLASWRNRESSLDTLLEAAMRHVADLYARRYAVFASAGASQVTVAFSGVDAADTFARIERYLGTITAADSVSPVWVSGADVVFRVSVNGGLQALQRSIRLAGWLSPDNDAADLAALYSGDSATAGYRIAQ